VRVVNVIDLMTLFAPSIHPHGMSDERFVSLFTTKKPVVFAFHGYQFAVHQLVHRRPHPARFHVRGFNEQGTTTTPFDMVVLNKISRFHLAALAVKQSSLPAERVAELVADLDAREAEAVRYTREHFEDPAEIRDWRWSS
jgi:xylulose-5-phosphate/fructose-6-phosphate phosphoketolase